MGSYEAKRFISILLMIFGVSGVVTALFVMFGMLTVSVPNELVIGVLLLMFGYQLNQEAQMDEITVPPK